MVALTTRRESLAVAELLASVGVAGGHSSQGAAAAKGKQGKQGKGAAAAGAASGALQSEAHAAVFAALGLLRHHGLFS